MKQARIYKLQSKLNRQQIDWLALVPSPSMVYLSGIHSHTSERPMVLFVGANGTVAAIMPKLEAMKAEAAGISADHIFSYTDQHGYLPAFQQATESLKLKGKRIGVESLKMRVLEGDLLSEVGGAAIVHADDLMDSLRLTKDADEIAAMQVAVDVAEAAIDHVLPLIKIGMTERKVAALLSQAILDAGADGLTFSPIVSAGENTTSPHAIPTNNRLQNGDLLILDWGAQVGDYVSDITRTFAVGEISDEQRYIYETVKASNAAGVAACRPNVTGAAIDKAARAVIDAAGYGDYFIHRTGHGLGMEAHESPSLVEGNDNPLPVGAVFTIEPGIYKPTVGGARIEDDIVLTESGYRSLTTYPRDLITIA
jgi:Xaa-Pro dipeptidase